MKSTEQENNMQFNVYTESQFLSLADSNEWKNPTYRDFYVPIMNCDGQWIAEIGNTREDVTGVYHSSDELSARLAKLVAKATDAAVNSLSESQARVEELEKQLERATRERNNNVKLATHSGLTLRQVAALTRRDKLNNSTGLSHQRVAQIVNA